MPCKSFVVAALLALALGSRAEAQTMIGACRASSGSGSPEGVTAGVGRICDVYIDTSNGVIYSKWTGAGSTNTGWQVGFNAAARVNGNLNITGYVGEPSYVSQLTNWRITAGGAADFRYVYTDELHAKLFIADLEQALAGGQIICKSVTTLGSNFTNPIPSPATGDTATLTVKDLPSAENVAVFQANDWVGLRSFTRTAGSLTIAETFGTVTAYADQAGGVQTWTFTRGTTANAGGMANGTVVATDAIVIDYGVSGNGCHEINAIDGANSVNSPYSQTWTWATSPIMANRTLRTRVGNLTGVTATSNEYGIAGGIFGGAATAQYFIASNLGLRLFGVDLSLFDGAGTRTMYLSRSGPYFSLGAAAPTTYGSVTGCWMGNDSGTYKFRCGIPGGAGVFWDGTTLSVVGQVTATSGVIGGWSIDSTSIRDTAGIVGMSSAVTGGDDVRFFAGNSTPTSALFRVTEAGELTMTNGFVNGTLDVNGTAQIDGSLTAGAGAVVLDPDGITISAGSGGPNSIKWTDGAYIFSVSDVLALVAGTGVQIFAPALQVTPALAGVVGGGYVCADFNGFLYAQTGSCP